MTSRNISAPSPNNITDEKNPYTIASAYRTLEVLKVFVRPPHQFALNELVKLMGIDKNQLYRSLKTLEQANFIAVAEDGRFALTSLVHDLSAASTQPVEKSVVEVAQPFLDDLAKTTNETVNLFVRSGDLAVCVDRRDSAQPVKLTSVVGMSVALHAGAVPKAMLAHLDETVQTEIYKTLPALPRYTAKTVLDTETLKRELALIKARGYSVSDEDYDASARGVGAAIFDEKGEVIGGISVGGPSFRVDKATLEAFGRLIVQAAGEISKRMGYSA